MSEIVQLPGATTAPPILELKNLRDGTRVLNDCLNDMGSMGLLIGNPGTSKTTAGKRFPNHARRSHASGDARLDAALDHLRGNAPYAVYVRMTWTDRRPAAMLKRLNAALGSERRHYGNSAELLNIVAYRVGNQINQRSSQKALIIVDEAQHLSDGAIEVLRDLCDLTAVSVALLGNPAFNESLDARGLAQFTSRCRYFHELEYEHDDMVALCRHFGVVVAREVREVEMHAELGGWLRRATDILTKARALLPDAHAKITMREIEGAVATTRPCIVPRPGRAVDAATTGNHARKTG